MNAPTTSHIVTVKYAHLFCLSSIAGVAELVKAGDLRPPIERFMGSNPIAGTIFLRM